MEAEPAFVDTNVLVYANQASSRHHGAAYAMLAGAAADGAALWISGQVIREYLAVVTRPQDGGAPLAMPTALDRVRAFTARLNVAEDGPEVRDRLRDLLLAYPTGGRQVHDANIVATMLVHGLRLCMGCGG